MPKLRLRTTNFMWEPRSQVRMFAGLPQNRDNHLLIDSTGGLCIL